MTREEIAAASTEELEAARGRLQSEHLKLSRRRAIEGKREVDEAANAADLALWRVKVELRRRALLRKGVAR